MSTLSLDKLKLSKSTNIAILEKLLEDLEVYRHDESNEVVKVICSRIAKDAAYIRDEQDMEIIMESILEFPVFSDSSSSFIGFLNATDSGSLFDPKTIYVHVSLAYYLGRKHKPIYSQLDAAKWIDACYSLLAPSPTNATGNTSIRVLRHVSAILCVLLTGNPTEAIVRSKLATDTFVTQMLNTVEHCRDGDAEYTFNLIKLIAILDSLNATQFVAANIISNRTSNCSNFAETLIHVFNRAEDAELQLPLVKLLKSIFDTPATKNIFYTNDLTVIVDIVARETQRSSDTELQHLFIHLISSIVDVGVSDDSKRLLRGTLKALVDAPYTHKSIHDLASKVLDKL